MSGSGNGSGGSNASKDKALSKPNFAQQLGKHAVAQARCVHSLVCSFDLGVGFWGGW